MLVRNNTDWKNKKNGLGMKDVEDPKQLRGEFIGDSCSRSCHFQDGILPTSSEVDCRR